MRWFHRSIVLAALVATVPCVADIQGFVLRLEEGATDQPIESWVAYGVDDKVHYARCLPSAADCTRASTDADVAERRTVAASLWISELGRSLGLDRDVLRHPASAAKRIDASIQALQLIVNDGAAAPSAEVATEQELGGVEPPPGGYSDAEREEARRKLARLAGKDGYRERFRQARELMAALEPPTQETPNLILEGADRRSTKVRAPFNLDTTAVKTTPAFVRTSDLITGLEWTALRATGATWATAAAQCRAADAGTVPTTEQATQAAPWLGKSPLMQPLRDRAGKGAVRFWLNSARSFRVNPTIRQGMLPTANLNGQKVYHYYQAEFGYFELLPDDPKGGRALLDKPSSQVSPRFESKSYPGGGSGISLVEPKDEEILTNLGPQTSTTGVLCVRKLPQP